ncbi:MAG: MATE family efflux transporter [Eubacteriales bacterium]|nr:MATE family efflux transporter [Eubacteriales bacterium]
MTKLFNDKEFWKTAVRLTIPVALQNLLTSSFTLADTLLVSSLGTVALSSVGMIGQWSWLMTMVLVGFCSATTVFISQFWGIKDNEKIKRISGISIIFAIVVSLIFTAISFIIPQGVVRMFNSDPQVIETGVMYLKIVAFSYIPVALTNIFAAILRSVENVKLPMYASAFTTVLNIFLDYCMIFGKFGFSKMGVRGAALATVISAWAGTILIIVISLLQKNILIGHFKEYFSFSKNELSSYLIKAAPVVLNEGMWGAGTFIFNIIFGNMGYEYFSALTILRSFENIAFVIFIGISSAASVMIGKSIGQGKIEKGLLESKRFMIIVPVLAVIISVFIVIFRGQLVSIFNMGNNVSQTAISTAQTLMLIYAVAFPFRMMPYLEIVAIFRSGGDTITGAKFELLTLWALAVPATLLAVYVFKAPFIVAFAVMYVFEDIPKNIFSFLFYRSKKWIKPVTQEGKDAYDKYKRERIGDE